MGTTILIVINVALLVIIVFVAVLFYYEVIYWHRARKIKRIQNREALRVGSVAEFKRRLLVSSLIMMNTGKKTEYPTLFADTFIKRLLLHIKYPDPVNIFSWRYSECGWLLYALIEAQCDTYVIKNIFDKHIYKEEIVCVDQSQCGMVALFLYERTQELKYKTYADSLWQFLIQRETEYGLPYRDIDANHILVDTIGMAIPFIIEYAERFQKSAQLAYRCIEKFIKYGTDIETGLPVFSFLTTYPHLKCGMSNWGRGCSWFVIGLSYVDKTKLNKYSCDALQKMEKMLVALWDRDKFFGHFLGETERDLSAELPILFYLYKRKLITLSEVEVLKYSEMCHDGVMYNSSSSNTGIIKYGTLLGPNVLSQVYMIRLINEFQAHQHV